MLIDIIRQDRKQAMLDKNATARTILSTLLGEIELEVYRKGETADTNPLVISVCKKFIDNNDKMMDVGSDAVIAEIEAENAIIKKYIPTQLTPNEIIDILKSNSVTSLGDGMKILKRDHAGLYSGEVAKAAINVYLSSL